MGSPNSGNGWGGNCKFYLDGDFFNLVKGTKSMKLEQKWNRSNDYTQECCFYCVITLKLLFSVSVCVCGCVCVCVCLCVSALEGGLTFGSGEEQHFGWWWVDSPYTPSRENSAIPQTKLGHKTQ